MPLLNEGTEVYRPVLSVLIEDNIYKIVGIESKDNIDDLDEDWMFPVNSIVKCKYIIRNGENFLVAYEQV